MTRPKGLAGIEQTEQIDPSELAYFKRVAQGLTKARELEQQAATARQQAIALQGAYDSWVTHLIERYHLDSEQDQIDSEDGSIRRGQTHANGAIQTGPPLVDVPSP